MAQIQVTDLTFCYDGSFDNIFENVSFSIDTNWKLGLIGRNGKGKTTFANLLLGNLTYQGCISAPNMCFDYFPYSVSIKDYQLSAADLMEKWKSGIEQWRVICELNELQIDAEVLYRPFDSLSEGEQVKTMLAVLFSGENDLLIIDEPTNHLDFEARNTVIKYLKHKKGFLLISHDRDFLDQLIDHVLVLNRKTIEVQSGNFSSWWENKQKKDAFAESENKKHLREIASLKRAAEKSSEWAEKNESTKIGFDPVKEHDRCISARAYIGAKTKKMQARVQSYQVRMEREIKDKEGLLADIEKTVALKLMPLSYHKENLIYAKDFSFCYEDSNEPVLSHFDFELRRNERIFLHGKNGCGKSTFLKQILKTAGNENIGSSKGILTVGSGLLISYVSQNTSHLKGMIQDYAKENHFELRLLLSLLRQLDMERVQFQKPMENFSEGQKKKVLLAGSLLTPAHLYIWDEPLNYIDIFSRMQIEEMILEYQPTMLIVDHDMRFREQIATRIVEV